MRKKRIPGTALKDKASKIGLLIMDVDGVLTPGYIIIDESGREIKVFDVQDGLGLALWEKAGLKSAVITAGKSYAVKKRMEGLKVDALCQKAKDKMLIYEKLKKRFSVTDKQVCFIGDDLLDLAPLKRAGLACGVPGARKEIMNCADYISRARGGRGAVREIIELILKSKGLWAKLINDYFDSKGNLTRK